MASADLSEEDFIDDVVEEFRSGVDNSPSSSVGIAVIRTLTSAITKTSARSFMGLDQEITRVTDAIQKACPKLPMHFRGAVQVFRAGMSQASKSKHSDWKSLFVAHANQCLSDAEEVLNLIPAVASDFVEHGMVVMTHGFDAMVASVLQVAASDGRQFRVLVTENRPRNDGVRLAATLSHPNITLTVVPDAAVGLWMNDVHVILVGTDLVLQDGGLLAPVGTYNICALASVHRKPVYCVCETFKFMRKFVLSANDMAQFQRKFEDFTPFGAKGAVRAEAREFDYTPGRFVALLLTERGPMPPSAVTHELTKLLGAS
jgi:translation initiation factor 2B subunit (eIF-2B alpha/beta/delta family)